MTKDYIKFNGLFSEELPKLLARNLIPASTAEIMKRRINGNEFFVKNTFWVSDLIAYNKRDSHYKYGKEYNEGEYKIFLPINNKKEITPIGEKYLKLINKKIIRESYTVNLNDEFYNSIQGEGVIELYRGREGDNDVRDGRTWRILARHPDEVPSEFAEDKNLLKEYKKWVKSMKGYKLNVDFVAPSSDQFLRGWQFCGEKTGLNRLHGCGGFGVHESHLTGLVTENSKKKPKKNLETKIIVYSKNKTDKNELSSFDLFDLVGTVQRGHDWDTIFRGQFIAYDVLTEEEKHKKTAENFVNSYKQIKRLQKEEHKSNIYKNQFWDTVKFPLRNLKGMVQLSRTYLKKREEVREKIDLLEKYSIIPEIIEGSVKYNFKGKYYSAPDVLIERLKIKDLKLPKHLDQILARTFMTYYTPDNRKIKTNTDLVKKGSVEAYKLLRPLGVSFSHDYQLKNHLGKEVNRSINLFAISAEEYSKSYLENEFRKEGLEILKKKIKEGLEIHGWIIPNVSKDKKHNDTLFMDSQEYKKFFNQLYKLAKDSKNTT